MISIVDVEELRNVLRPTVYRPSLRGEAPRSLEGPATYSARTNTVDLNEVAEESASAPVSAFS